MSTSSIVTHVEGEIVRVRRSGQRARVAEEALRQAGLTNVQILDGGMTAWQSMGFRIGRGTQRWDLKSSMRLMVGFLVLGGVLRSIAAPKLKWMAASIGARLAVAALTNTPPLGSADSCRYGHNRFSGLPAEPAVQRVATVTSVGAR